jgi:hypothetical protein
MSNVSIRTIHADKSLAQINDEQVRCYELRLQGKTLQQIAAIMTAEGCPMSKDTVDRRIKAEMKIRIEPLADELRALEMDRLDRYLDKLEPRIEQGDDKAIHAAIRIMERRAKYLGLDAPERVDMRVQAIDTELNSTLSTADDEPDADVLEGEWSE